MIHGTRVLPVLAALGLMASGCQSLGLFVKKEAAVDARLGSVERRVDDHEHRLATLETSVIQVADVSRDARDRADVALARTDVPGRRSPARAGRDTARALLGTVHVLFGFDSAELDDRAQKALLAVVEELRGNPGLTVDLEGATDPKGSRGYNLQLSQRRVEAVRRFLLAKGVLSLRIVESSAVGPIGDARVPESQKRRVSVKLMKLVE
jgi:outer membrane protein OmpA-like peptidoglycan-associated protein